MTARPIKIYLEIPAGHCIGEASRDAIMMAMEYQCNIEFNFNGKTYKYIFNDLIGTCLIT